MKVQCKVCGHTQEFSSSFPYCFHCGATLDVASKTKIKISRKERNIQGIAIMLFFFFVCVFFFLSRFIGTLGAIVSVIIWIIAKFLERKKIKIIGTETQRHRGR